MQTQNLNSMFSRSKYQLKSKFFLTLFSFVLFLTLSARVGNTASASYTYLNDQKDGKNQIAIFNTDSFSEVDQIGSGQFTAVAISSDGKKIYASRGDGVIDIIDTATNEISLSWHIPFVTEVSGIAILPNQPILYAASPLSNAIVRIDVSTNPPTMKTPIPITEAKELSDLIASPDGQFVYVGGTSTKVMNRGVVSIIEVFSNKVVETVLLQSSGKTEKLSLNKDRNILYALTGSFVLGNHEYFLEATDLTATPKKFLDYVALGVGQDIQATDLRVTSDNKFYLPVVEKSFVGTKYGVRVYDFNNAIPKKFTYLFGKNLQLTQPYKRIAISKDEKYLILDGDSGILRVERSDYNERREVGYAHQPSLYGDFVGPTLTSEVSLSTKELDFGNVMIQTASGSKVVVVEAKYVPMGVQKVEIQANHNDFSISPPFVACPRLLGQICGIPIVFTPTILGNRTGKLLITDSDNVVHEVGLSGTGVEAPPPPAPEVSFSLAVFPDQPVNKAGQPQTIIFTVQKAPMEVKSVMTTGDFKATHNCAKVGVGESCQIQVVFTPTVSGNRTGTLTVIDTQDRPYQLNLSGKGVADLGGSRPGPGGGGCSLSSALSFHPIFMMLWIGSIACLIWKRKK